MKIKNGFILLCLLIVAFPGTVATVGAGYKAHAWNIGARENYPASLTSEGVTIAAEPLYADALASQVFDKDDMVTRGIMPLAIYIFNDNDFEIEVDGRSIELICKDDHIRTMTPYEVVYRLYRKGKEWIKQPIPRISSSKLNQDALEDFESKFLLSKTVAPHGKGGGFLYLHISDGGDLASYLSTAAVYIPKIYRQDNGSRLIYFEIELNAAFKAVERR